MICGRLASTAQLSQPRSEGDRSMEILKPVDIARRRLLLGVSAAAATQLAACATCKREEFPGTSRLAPLTALSGSAGPKAKAGGVFIDAHAHFFNARDVQVEGFIAKPLAHSLKDKDLAELARKLAPIAARLAYLAPSPAKEMGLLQEMTGRLGAMSAEAAAKAMEDGLLVRRRLVLTELQKALNQDADILQLYQRIQTRALQKSVGGISFEYLEGAANLGSGFDVAKQPSIEMRGAMTGSKAEVEKALGMAGIFRFVVLMLSPRVDNVYSFKTAYAAGSPDVPLAGAVDALVEFNHWLGRPCNASLMMDQVKLHEQLVRISGGFVLPVVGYNPATDLRDEGLSLRVVQDAVTNFGFIGVKIYPPNGFLPYGNGGSSCPLPSDRPSWWDGAKIDEKLRTLYDWCDKNGVPVMAHANDSMGVDDEHNHLAGVCGWRALDTDPKVKISSLTVNAGHVGGDGADSSDWTAQFTTLMKDASRLRLFGDLGYWDQIATPKGTERLRAALRASIAGGATAVDRVMYGSDWLMLSRVDGYERYGATVLQVLRSLNLSAEDIGKVLGGNALTCYGLRSNDTNFQRFSSHFGEDVMRRARWAEAGKLGQGRQMGMLAG